MQHKTIAILTGGESSEREVSLWSSVAVIDLLSDRYDIRKYIFPEELDRFLSDRHLYSLAIPVMHGSGGEDGKIQGFLKVLGIPYIFSDILPLSLSMDKNAAKIFAYHYGLNVADSVIINRGEKHVYDKKVIVKPVDGGSSIGTAIATSQSELDRALEGAFKYSDSVMIEDFISGREFTVGVLEEAGKTTALPVTEIVSDGLFDFERKYVTEKMASEICPADLVDRFSVAMQRYAVTIHEALGIKNLSRSDFILDSDNKIWFLEINAIPGLTNNSIWPKALEISGRNMASVLCGWIESSIQRQHQSV